MTGSVVSLRGDGQLWLRVRVRGLRGAGREPGAALRALLPLLRASVESLERVGLPAALTGPIARGDTGTIAAHLAWLDAHAAEPGIADLRAAYLALARLAIPIAEAKGALTPESAEALRGLVE